MVCLEAGREQVQLWADSWERTVGLGTGTPCTTRREMFTLETPIPAFPSGIKCVLLPKQESRVLRIRFHGTVTGWTPIRTHWPGVQGLTTVPVSKITAEAVFKSRPI